MSFQKHLNDEMYSKKKSEKRLTRSVLSTIERKVLIFV